MGIRAEATGGGGGLRARKNRYNICRRLRAKHFGGNVKLKRKVQLQGSGHTGGGGGSISQS